MTKEQKGYLYIILFEIVAGFASFSIKNINTAFPASLLVLTRFTIASAFFGILILWRKEYRREVSNINKKQMVGLFYLGAIGSGIVTIIYVGAVRLIGITLSTLIENLEIPFGIILAVLFLGERLTARFMAIASIILAGFYLLIFRGNISILPGYSFLYGVFLALLSGIIWASATLAGKKLLNDRVSIIMVSFFRNLFGMAAGLAVALVSVRGILSAYEVLSVKDWILLFYLGFGVSGIGFIVYYEALKDVEVKKISLFFVMSTLISVLLGVWSGEMLSLAQWIGAGAILVGIAMLLKTPNKTVILEEKNLGS